MCGGGFSGNFIGVFLFCLLLIFFLEGSVTGSSEFCGITRKDWVDKLPSLGITQYLARSP